jgi:parallel beta-helix repeat protein
MGTHQAGIGIMDDAGPVLSCNEIRANRSGGIVMAGRSRAVLSNNDITGNGFAGIGLKEAASPLLVSNRLCGNKGYGILMHGASKATVQDCLVRRSFFTDLRFFPRCPVVPDLCLPDVSVVFVIS